MVVVAFVWVDGQLVKIVAYPHAPAPNAGERGETAALPIGSETSGVGSFQTYASQRRASPAFGPPSRAPAHRRVGAALPTAPGRLRVGAFAASAPLTGPQGRARTSVARRRQWDSPPLSSASRIASSGQSETGSSGDVSTLRNVKELMGSPLGLLDPCRAGSAQGLLLRSRREVQGRHSR